MDLEEYEIFWNSSAQSSPFNAPWFIKSVTKDPVIFFYEDDYKLLAALYFEKSDGKLVIPKFSVYHSVLLSGFEVDIKKLGSTQSKQRLLSDVLTELKEKFNHFELSLHPSLHDVRSFSWSNLHSKETRKMTIEPKYTAIKKIEMNKDNHLDYSTWSSGRKYDLKKSIRMGIEIQDFNDIEIFMELYMKTFDRQYIEIQSDILKIIEKLFHAIPIEKRVAKVAVDRHGKVLSAGITIIHKDVAFGLFMANGIESRNSGSSTLLTYQLMVESHARGARQYDFVGANSPNRGDYKLSFNSTLKLYFETSLT